MANSLLTPSIIAKEALMQLENNLVMGNLVHRAYEDEFTKLSNGNKVGSTITIRKPVRYTVRSGNVAATQDTTEGTTTIVVDRQRGVDMAFSSTDLTLTIADFSKRYIEPAMSQLANTVDADLYSLFSSVPNWVGTPGNTINSIPGFNAPVQRMTELAVPATGRRAVLSPADYFGMVNSFSTLFAKQGATAETAIRRAMIGTISEVDTYQAQNVQTFTRGTATNTTPLVDGPNQTSTYANVKDTNTQSLLLKGAGNAVTYKAGDIITLDGVFAVNPVSKSVLPYLRQFVVTTNTSSDSGGAVTLTISPAIITSGAYQTCSAAPADSAPVTILGTASTGYPQNLFFHENAFALCMVPMEMPEGAVRAARQTYKGLSVRVIPYYDGTNDVSNWRFDILYGVRAIYPELAIRASGASS